MKVSFLKILPRWSFVSVFVFSIVAVVVDGFTQPSPVKGSLLKDEFFVSFEGVVANTSKAKTKCAIQVAVETWPTIIPELLYDIFGNDHDWLINKMMALSHITQTNVDTVLLVRLLLEEQLLDQDASIHCNGKYASQFHPSSSSSSSSSNNNNPNNGSSRPLTVGEIAANWSMLQDTIRMKYNINRKDPIPIIEENWNTCMKTSNLYQEHVELHENICSAIQTSEHENNITILVGHESLIPWIAQLLNVNCIVPSSSESTIPISKKKGTRTHFIHSHISILNQSKFLLGDDSPRFRDGYIMDGMDETIQMSLRLPVWADNVNSQQINDADMDAWMTTITQDELLDLLSTSQVFIHKSTDE